MESEQSTPSDSPGPGRPGAGAGPVQTPPAKMAAIEEQLAKAQEEVQKYLNNWHRAEADFQNYKRRTEQEREELRRYGNVSIIINLLPVLDDFERAFGSRPSHLAGLSWFDRILLIF